jgi:hypothetical protein
VIASVSLPCSGLATVAGGRQVRPPSRERLATTAVVGGSVEMSAPRPLKYTVPSPPAATHGSEPASAVPPVQAVSPGMVRRFHVLPPSREEATRSLRDWLAEPTSCFQAATMLRGLAGLTVTAGSSSWPVMAWSSKRAPGQPPANGLGPDTTRRSFTLYGRPWCGPAPATAADGVLVSSSTLASSADPARKDLDLIAHPPARAEEEARSALRPRAPATSQPYPADSGPQRTYRT